MTPPGAKLTRSVWTTSTVRADVSSPNAGRRAPSAFRARKSVVSRVMRKHLTRRDEKGAGYGEVGSAWTNRVQPANSKSGNWWQSPLCGAHTDRHFRESPGFGCPASTGYH